MNIKELEELKSTTENLKKFLEMKDFLEGIEDSFAREVAVKSKGFTLKMEYWVAASPLSWSMDSCTIETNAETFRKISGILLGATEIAIDNLEKKIRESVREEGKE